MEDGTHKPETDELALDTVFALLSDRYRRNVVEILADRESPLALRDLATAIAAAEPAIESTETEPTHEVTTALHHVHLPKLDAADVVDYDPETNTVSPERTAALTPFVTPVDDGQ